MCGFDDQIVAHGVHIQMLKALRTVVGVLDVSEATDEHSKAVSLLSR